MARSNGAAVAACIHQVQVPAGDVAAISSGWPARFSGVAATAAAKSLTGASKRIGVSMKLGEMLFAVMPQPANSIAKVRVSAAMPPLVAA